MDELLACERLEKWVDEGHQRIALLRPLSFSLATQEFVAITGPSGSGKSTLLYLLGLLDQASAGSLRFLGKETAQLSEEERAALRANAIGFVFQLFHLVPHLTVFDNAALPMRYARRRPDAAEVMAVLEKVNIAAHAQDYPATLSGGEKQRAAIARALINRPKLLLADEPTGALDSANGLQVMQCLEELHRNGTTVILVTHDAALAKHAQRVLRLRDGALEAA